MAKAKLRMRRLTIAPRSDLHDGRVYEDSNDDEENQAMRRLDRERFARAIELSVAAREGNRKGFHMHGKEPEFSSKFWAKDDGENSDSESEEDEQVKESEKEDITTPMLLSEALNVGFSLEQIKLAEAELESPQQMTTKVRSNLKQGSISKQIVDVWMANHKGKAEPWSGPLPPPRMSSLRTLGDMFAKAKHVQRSPETSRECLWGHRQDHRSPEFVASVMSKMKTRSVQVSFPDQAPISANSKPWLDDLTEPGRHDVFMGHNDGIQTHFGTNIAILQNRG
jgi:hypothetical protein